MGTVLIFLRKELWQIRRDRKILGMLLGAPVIQLLLLGYAATFDIKHIPLAVCDLDVSESSRRLVESFTNSGYFTVTARTRDLHALDDVMDANTARIGLVIPRGYERDSPQGCGHDASSHQRRDRDSMSRRWGGMRAGSSPR